MRLIDPYIVKVIHPNGTGSGFLLYPESDPDCVYIITARHLFLDESSTEIQKDKIRVEFSDNTYSYQLSDTDIMFYGNNNEFEDCAVIILPAEIVGDNIDLMESPVPIAIAITEKIGCLVSGYPKITNNNARRTLYKCHILTDKDYQNEIQVEVNDQVSHQYNADDLVEGYSGSPIFIAIEDNVYIVGVFLGYEPQTKRITAMSIGFVNNLLERNQIPPLSIGFKELDPILLTDIKKTQTNSERILNRIRNNIGDLHISRPDLEKELRSVILQQTLTVIYGKPGIGKSAIAKKVLGDLNVNGYSVIALQGEQLDKLSIQEVFSNPAIGISTGISEMLSSSGLTKNKIILIDSIEKLLETNNAETIIDFFTLIKSRDDLRLVLTCRSYAIEQLKIRFLQQFKDFHDFQVPVLNGKELDLVTTTYPFLKALLSNPSLKRILQIPFNIDKATVIHRNALSTVINSELDFKQIMWDYVIEGLEHEPDAANRKLRGALFSEIAYKRAEAMVPYIGLPTDHQQIIVDLQRDQLIDTDLTLGNRYAPAHDIYEDWALTRKIEADFQDYLANPVITDFFEAIGAAPSIRRAFRIWISEKLQIIDFNIKELILDCLAEPGIANYWKDEILIAIIQSPYSKDFLDNNKDFLFENQMHLFKRCALLLRVACQSPDLSYLPLLKAEQKNYIYMSSYLKPYGEGWGNMISFMFAHLDELAPEFKLLLQIIFQWGKTLDVRNLPAEATSAALVIHGYFQHQLEHSKEDNLPALDREETASAIQLLFRLSKLIPEEVRAMMSASITDDKKSRYESSGFWDSFKHIVLSWEYSYPVCELFPELVLAIAEKEWFYYPPSEEELQERYGNSPLGYFPRQIDTEEKFGLTHDRDYRYSPSSAYQTPISHLLRHHPLLTLDFILRLLNHSADAFFKSDYLKRSSFWGDDERKIFKIEIDATTSTEVYGSQLLWNIYRGLYNITSPHLLQSVLMALEKWMLEIAEVVANDKDYQYPVKRQNFEFVFTHLLTETRSVSILSLLVGVATAQPELCKKLVQPLLKTRLFYKWDLIRRSREGGARFITFDDSKLIKMERKQSDEMPHHSEEMEMLIRRLTLTSERKAIYAILDEFYTQNSTDVHWKLALNRMDLRKVEVIKETENQVLLMPKLDEELKPLVAEAERAQQDILPIQIAGNWARQKWDGKAFENDNYRQWQLHYQHVINVNPDNSNTQLFNQPGTLAAVGIRYYFEVLSDGERNWCLGQIFRITEAEVRASHNQFNIGNDGTYSAFDPDHIFQVLVTLIGKCRDEHNSRAKELLFVSLIFINNDLYREKLTKSIREELWRIDPAFALNCVAGLLEYAKIAELKTRVNHFHPGLRFQQQPSWKKSKFANRLLTFKNKIIQMILGNTLLTKRRVKADESLRQEWADQYDDAVEGIIDQAVTGTIALNYTNESGVKYSSHHLIEVLTIIPFDSNHADIENYYNFVIDYLLNQVARQDLNRQEEIHFSLIQTFTKHFAEYLLAQATPNVLPLFKKMTGWLLTKGEKPIAYRFNDKRLELVKELLREMLWQVYIKDSAPGSFWLVWEHVFDELAQDVKFFNKLLLLNHGLSGQHSWAGIKGKKPFFQKVIKKLADLDETTRLLAGVGFDELMPEGLEWYADILRETPMKEPNTIYLTEKLAINVYYEKRLRKIVKESPRLKRSFIFILDALINQSSSAAFLIREDFISIK